LGGTAIGGGLHFCGDLRPGGGGVDEVLGGATRSRLGGTLAVGIVAVAGYAGGCCSAAALADFDEAVVGIKEVAGIGLRRLLTGKIAVGIPGIGGTARAAGGAGQGFAKEPVVGIVAVLGGFGTGSGDVLLLATVADGIVLVGGAFRGGLGAAGQPSGEFAAGVAVFSDETGAVVVGVAECFTGRTGELTAGSIKADGAVEPVDTADGTTGSALDALTEDQGAGTAAGLAQVCNGDQTILDVVAALGDETSQVFDLPRHRHHRTDF
jgi:hypothetical protein